MCSGHLCECGCGNITNIYRGKPRRFMKDHYRSIGFGLWWYENKPHPSLGIKRPDAVERMKNNGNPEWKGDDVGKDAVHQWIKRRLPKPDKCQKCGLIPPYDLACVTGIYNRDFKNWQYWCRKCHMTDDGRMEKLKIYAKTAAKKRWSKR